MFVCLSVERWDLGTDLYHATNVVTRVVQCHLKDCSNLLAMDTRHFKFQDPIPSKVEMILEFKNVKFDVFL